MRLVLHPKVSSDISKIMEFYEQVATAELADEFYRKLRHFIHEAAERPESFAIRERDKGLDTTQEKREEILKSLESVKHYLWHGNVVRARDKLEDLHGILDHEGIAGENGQKLRTSLDSLVWS